MTQSHLTAALAFVRDRRASAEDAASEVSFAEEHDSALIAQRLDRIGCELAAIGSVLEERIAEARAGRDNHIAISS